MDDLGPESINARARVVLPSQGGWNRGGTSFGRGGRRGYLFIYLPYLEVQRNNNTGRLQPRLFHLFHLFHLFPHIGLLRVSVHEFFSSG